MSAVCGAFPSICKTVQSLSNSTTNTVTDPVRYLPLVYHNVVAVFNFSGSENATIWHPFGVKPLPSPTNVYSINATSHEEPVEEFDNFDNVLGLPNSITTIALLIFSAYLAKFLRYIVPSMVRGIMGTLTLLSYVGLRVSFAVYEFLLGMWSLVGGEDVWPRPPGSKRRGIDRRREGKAGKEELEAWLEMQRRLGRKASRY